MSWSRHRFSCGDQAVSVLVALLHVEALKGLDVVERRILTP